MSQRIFRLTWFNIDSQWSKKKKPYVRTKVSVYFHKSNSYPTSESKFSWLWMNDIVCAEAAVVRKLRYSFRGCISRKLEATVISRLYFFILFYCFYFINKVWAVFNLKKISKPSGTLNSLQNWRSLLRFFRRTGQVFAFKRRKITAVLQGILMSTLKKTLLGFEIFVMLKHSWDHVYEVETINCDRPCYGSWYTSCSTY